METIESLKDRFLSSGGKLPIYADYQSTTPMDPIVFDEMKPYFLEKFGNPHSRTHVFGWEAESAVEIARARIAKVIGANEKEIIFTSGATESNNIAIKGVAHFYKSPEKNHIVTIVTEHKCVIDTCRHLEQEGFSITYLSVSKNGILDLDDLRNSITSKTIMVSVMHVNNEIGVIQPIKEIGAICREKGVFFHSDIAQSFGKIPVNVDECNIDLASISSHKIYGPKGIGALYIRRRPRVRVVPIVNGGGQERGMRSGTISPALSVGFGFAAELALSSIDRDYNHVRELSDFFIDKIFNNIQHVYLNGDRKQRYPGNINISFAYIEGESLILAIKDVAVSSGSACTSASLEPSYVLSAIGVDETLAHTSIRFGFGRFTTKSEVEYLSELLINKVNHLRNMSPLWEMVQEGVDLNTIVWSEH